MKNTEVENTLKLIDSEIEKWGKRKIWIENCDLKRKEEEIIFRLENTLDENEKLKRYLSNPNNKGVNPKLTMFDIEKLAILERLKYFSGNRQQTAESLGITIKTLYNKLFEYGHFDDINKELK